MAIGRRILFFIIINLVVTLTLSLVLNLLHVQPYLRAYGLDMKSLMIFCLIWGMGGALLSLAMSRQIAKWVLGVRVIDPRSSEGKSSALLQSVYALARQAGLSAMPQVGIFESSEPNAFATGPTQRSSLIAVSSGLLNRMSQNELEGVLAHEIAHIKNGDMVTMTLLQGIVNAFVMFLARILAFVCSGLGKNRQNSSSSSGGSYLSYMLFVFLFEMVFMLFGMMIICAFSRYREFRADRGGAELAGKEKMIAALESLKRTVQMRDRKLDQSTVAAFKISSEKKRGLLSLLSTHPSLEERISRLQK
jgi:heat shock protein HtpX